MNSFFASLEYALIVTFPSLAMLCLGIYLRRRGQIDADFCTKATRLVFNYGLPLLLFINLVNNDIHYGEQAILLSAGATSTFILFFGAELYARRFIDEPRDQGVFVQGVFRSNMAILGLAFVQNAYGKAGLAGGAVYMGVITILYNILAVITLSRSTEQQSLGLAQKGWLILKNILKNPLIIGICSALLLKALHIPVPTLITNTAHNIANLSLPLALICAGASFNLKQLHGGDIAISASIGRLIIAPIVAVLVGLLFGLRGIPMGILFLMTANSAAASSYVMAKAMGANDIAAANILGITTLGATFSAAIGIIILRALGWI